MGLKNRKIHQLSGGQQQRVALARGLVLEPSVLLLDEPLSNLDAELRQQMRELIRSVQAQTGTTMLFVTHDQSEAFAISDRICVLLDGSLRQTGTPTELFYQPADPDVARFFGCANFISGRIRDGLFEGGFVRCATSLGDSPEAIAVIRPEDVVLSSGWMENGAVGKVVQIQFEGSITRLTIEVENESLPPFPCVRIFIWNSWSGCIFPLSGSIFSLTGNNHDTQPDPFDHYLTQVKHYLLEQSWDQVSPMAGRSFTSLRSPKVNII